MTDSTHVDETGGLPTDARRLTVSRVFAASPQRLYDAYLDPDDLVAWMPPSGFHAEIHSFDPVVGGEFRLSFVADREELAAYTHTFHGTYRELVPGERIVHTDQFEVDDPAMAGEMVATVTFEPVGGGTEMTVVQEGLPEAISLEDARAGWKDSFDNLERLVEAR